MAVSTARCHVFSEKTRYTVQINSDFNQRVVVRPGDVNWTPTAMPGVERQMLERIGEEIARATSIVRYAPGSSFHSHTHGGGEEILVLEGGFSDQYGEYSPGAYLRNPIGSSHAPYSETGCTLLVKLHQFDLSDQLSLVIDTRSEVSRKRCERQQTDWQEGMVRGLSVLPLHTHGGEHTALVRWAAGTRFNRHQHWGGEEIYVIEGTFQDEYGDYPQGSWLRSPHRSQHSPFSEHGCLIYVKTGHLFAG